MIISIKLGFVLSKNNTGLKNTKLKTGLIFYQINKLGKKIYKLKLKM